MLYYGTVLGPLVCPMDGNDCRMTQMRNIGLSNKDLNRLVKSRNGNRSQSVLKIIHWNGGARLWLNKLIELESLLLENISRHLFYLGIKLLV